jgi:hypothetical protein
LKDFPYEKWRLRLELISSGVELTSSLLFQIEWRQVVAQWLFVEFEPRYETEEKGGGL